MIKDLVIKRGENLQITFQSNIDIVSFEKLLLYAYPLTKKKGVEKIALDFSKVYWCDVLQLSMICLWIQEMKERNKEISMIFPTNEQMNNFLENYGFNDFLIKESIVSNSRKNIRENKKFVNKPFLPLTFLDQSEFSTLLTNLENEDYFNVLFDEVRHVAIAKKGIIKDVILKELGDNMYAHGGGKFSNVIMTKHSSQKKQMPYGRNLNSLNVTVKEANYIVFVISDKGQGIFKKLNKNYEHDILINNKKTLPTHADLIEYATYEHTTSRTRSERLKLIEAKISEELESIAPFTGLFQIKETIKSYKGILVIRSGDSFVIFNFNDGQEKIIKSSDIKGFKTLSAFGGTQIKIILPIVENYDALLETTQSYLDKDTEDKIVYKYIRLDNYFETQQDLGSEKLAEQYSNVIDEIKATSYSNDVDGVIVDFINRTTIDSKIQFLIISLLIKLQELQAKVHAAINFDKNMANLINQSLQNKKIATSYPLVILDESLNRDIIGLNEYDRLTFKAIQKIDSFDQEEHLKFASTYRFLFSVSKDSNVEYRHNKQKIIKFVSSAIQLELAKVITNPENNIYYKDLKVLTQNGIYFDCYYQVQSLLTNSNWKNLIKEWISYNLFLIRPSHLISLSIYFGQLLDEIIRNAKIESVRSIVHRNLRTPLQHNEILELTYLSNIKKLIICTDVIATGYSIRDLLEYLTLKVPYIITLINVTTNTWLDKEKSIKIRSILDNPIPNYHSKPSDWLYEEIHFTDPDTHKVLKRRVEEKISKTFPKHSTLEKLEIKRELQTVDGENLKVRVNPFLSEIVIPNYAYFIKVISEGKFMPVMFNIPLILKKIENEIVQDLLISIEYLRLNKSFAFKHFIFFDNDNYNNIKSLSKNIIKQHPTIQIHNLSYNHLEPHYENPFDNKSVVVFEDAFISGENIFRILDYCERNNAKSVFIYVLIKRGPNNISNRIEKIKNYGRTQVFFKYVFDVEIPGYAREFNPITKTLDDYKTILNRFQNFNFSTYVKAKIVQSTYKDVRSTLTEFSNEEYVSYYILLRWKLEQAKNYLDDRKELSYLLTKSKDSNLLTAITSAILFEEKNIFLENSAFIKHFFYPKFKEMFTEKIVTLLNNSLAEVDALSKQDIIATLIYLDESKLISFIKSEKAIEFFKDEQELLYPLICALLLSPKSLMLYSAKILYIEKVLLFCEDKMDLKAFLIFLKDYWIKEKNELFGDFYNEKVNYIKTLLKASFHEINKKIDYLKIAINKDDAQEVLALWGNIQNMLGSAFETLELLFYKENYNLDSHDLTTTISTARNSLLLVQPLINIEAIAKLNKNHEEIISRLNSLEDKLLGESGLVSILEREFRTELKELFSVEKEILEQHNISVGLEFDDKSCVVFCRKVDIMSITSNLRENIIKHSGASKVLIVIKKVIDSGENLIFVEILDDGNLIDYIKDGIGISTAYKTAFKYSGTCKVERLKPHDQYFDDGFRTIARLILHDLSKEILNSPNYA